MNARRALIPAALALSLSTLASPARAEPWFGWGQNRTEDRYTSGDLDLEDLVNGTVAGTSLAVKDELRSGTWLTLGGYFRSYEARYQDIGVFLLAGVAFDRVMKGRRGASAPAADDAAGLADGTSTPRPAPPPTAVTPVSPPAPAAVPVAVTGPGRIVVTSQIARHAVAAAWRASGLGVDDARVDSMVARARSSAALPEARFRVMRVFADATTTGIVPIDTSTYASAGNSMVLEARLTWRFDQLLYSSDEGSLERLRIEREAARAKVAGKVLDALFQWQRAWLAVRGAVPGTREATDAAMRLLEAEAGLDVLTAGWFSAWWQEEEAGGVP